jgi:hypothetical protein
VDRTKNVDYIFANKLDHEGRNPTLAAGDDPRQMFLRNEAIVMPRQNATDDYLLERCEQESGELTVPAGTPSAT